MLNGKYLKVNNMFMFYYTLWWWDQHIQHVMVHEALLKLMRN